MENKFKGIDYPLISAMFDDEPLLSCEEFRRIMLSRNIETNNPKLHNRIIRLCNPNREHWLKKFMDLYLQNDERSE